MICETCKHRPTCNDRREIENIADCGEYEKEVTPTKTPKEERIERTKTLVKELVAKVREKRGADPLDEDEARDIALLFGLELSYNNGNMTKEEHEEELEEVLGIIG